MKGEFVLPLSDVERWRSAMTFWIAMPKKKAFPRFSLQCEWYKSRAFLQLPMAVQLIKYAFLEIIVIPVNSFY